MGDSPSRWRASFGLAFVLSFMGACGATSSEPIVNDVDVGPLPSIQSLVTLTPDRPGATDPGLTFAKWPDDEIFMVGPSLSPGVQGWDIYEPTDWTSGGGYITLKDAYAGVAGRFLTAERDYVVLASRNGSNLQVNFLGNATSWTSPLIPRTGSSTDFFDIAAADLDGMAAADEAGSVDRQDELVVAHIPVAGKGLQVTVLGFSAGSPPSPYVTTVASTTRGPTLETAYAAHNVVSLTTGDFDGDMDSRIAAGLGRVKEVAVAYVAAPNQLALDVFRYAAVWDSASHSYRTSLTLMGSGGVTLDARVTLDSISAAAGDFNGDGLDELAVATSHHDTGGNMSIDVRLFRNTAIAGKPPVYTQVQDIPLVFHPVTGTAGRVQLAAGLFTFDPVPANGWGLLRRQLAVAYRDGASLCLRTIDLVDASLSWVLSAPYTYPVAPDVTFTLAAGGFRGALVRPPTNGQNNDPTWSLALLTWYGPVGSNPSSNWFIHVLQPGSTAPGTSKPAPAWTNGIGPHFAAGPPTAGGRLALAAVDQDGDSVYLGAPMHLVVQDFLSADFILEEPPKHAFWNRTTHKVENVNRLDDFNLLLGIEGKTEMTASRTDNVSYAVGGSATASASTSVSAGANIGIVSAKASVKTEVSASVGYDYTHSESELNSLFRGLETQTIGVTSRDDYILGRIRSFDVWRYRIYGLRNDDPANPYSFFDFVLPAPAADELLVTGGASRDWYQPRHENGNIFSYAENDDAFRHPPDVGAVARDGVGVDPRVIPGLTYTYGGTSGKQIMKFTESETQEVSFSYNHAIKANASIKTTASAEASAFGVKTAATGSLGFEAHGNYSWGENGLNKTSTSKSTGLTLSIPPRVGQKAYTFHPMAYVTGDGALKVTYSVDTPPIGASFWEGLYSLPDLALNLPNRFAPVNNPFNVPVWQPYKLEDRKKMKGFFVRKETPNPVTGEYDLIRPDVVPDPGMAHRVRLQARVYNYSIRGPVLAAPTPARACFHLIELVEGADYLIHEKERPGPANLIGCAYLPEILARGMVTAEVLWDTNGRSNGTTQDYRIYVRLDPDNVVRESHENAPDWSETCGMYELDQWGEPTTTCVDVDPGQNNEGYAQIKVVTNVSMGGEGPKHAHISMLKDAMAGLDRSGQVLSGNVQTYVNVPFRYRVKVWSDVPTHASSYLLVYDGEPSRGGELIATQEVFAGDPRGSATWFVWTPTRIGAHHLYAKILQKLDDPEPGGNIGVLNVVVIPKPPGLTR